MSEHSPVVGAGVLVGYCVAGPYVGYGVPISVPVAAPSAGLCDKAEDDYRTTDAGVGVADCGSRIICIYMCFSLRPLSAKHL